MNKPNNHFRTVALAVTITAAALTGAASASTADSSVKLLTAQFEPRQVVQVEIGDFHFTPGQIAPIHTHAAPAVGYVAKGEIIYQVEGEKQQILSAGDVFYEPVGPRILRFDNASATQEAMEADAKGGAFPYVEFSDDQAYATLPVPSLRIIGLHDVDQEEIERILPLTAEWQGTGPFMTEVTVTQERFGSVPTELADVLLRAAAIDSSKLVSNA